MRNDRVVATLPPCGKLHITWRIIHFVVVCASKQCIDKVIVIYNKNQYQCVCVECTLARNMATNRDNNSQHWLGDVRWHHRAPNYQMHTHCRHDCRAGENWKQQNTLHSISQQHNQQLSVLFSLGWCFSVTSQNIINLQQFRRTARKVSD